ncbi:acetoin utilization AcuB family protein [Microaerobacter geothermalis]|uniref:acetoin utilization AcuB family protein n=1 Tax=Microaerobacter geothermalis TaxID=674972 RepID=UPI001F1AE7F2|nr:acetoin utilization AcuB family protein [Microaerobacter geothermalis]MCF6094908.1 acetoin utilization AcuB family protein [Microaerobacter geothermalis]
MLVEEIMKRNVITVEPTDSIRTAYSKVQQHRIRHIPVVKGDQLLGIISDRDLRDAFPSTLCGAKDDVDVLDRPVSEIMHRDVITAHPLDFVEEAALTLYDNHIGCLPVVNQNQLVGILTETDILHTLVELMGVHHPSSHIEVEVEDRAGMLADVASVFKECKANVTSVLVFPGRRSGKKNLVFRVQTMDPRRIIKSLKEKGYTVVWPQEPGSIL